MLVVGPNGRQYGAPPYRSSDVLLCQDGQPSRPTPYDQRAIVARPMYAKPILGPTGKRVGGGQGGPLYDTEGFRPPPRVYDDRGRLVRGYDVALSFFASAPREILDAEGRPARRRRGR